MKKAIIAYVPVLHEGYVRFFERHPKAPLYLLGKSAFEEFGDLHLERDLRALKAEDVVKALRRMDVCRGRAVNEACITELEHLSKVLTCAVMPDEDISHRIAEKHFGHCEIVFDTAFLRWDRNRAVLEQEMPADRTISRSDFVAEVMKRAEEEAEKSSDWWRQVGAVAVKDGKILAMAHNQHLPSPHAPYVWGDPRSSFNAGEYIELSTALHAEAALVSEAARREDMSLEGADIHVTTFPCPPCAKLLAVSGIKRLFFTTGYSKLDALDVLRHAGIEIIRVV